MNKPFESTVALVTGAASGMGWQRPRRSRGRRSCRFGDFKEDAVKLEAQKLVAAGHKAIAVRCDVSDDAQVAAMVERTVAEFADSTPPSIMQALWLASPDCRQHREDWDRVIGVNLRGVWTA